jgi:hypothetical protein
VFSLLLLLLLLLQVTYREFAYGHMDFTSLAAFSIKDEMRYHVMRALNANN